MLDRSIWPLAALLAVTQAVQPSAPRPIPATLRELPWGQLNFLHTTDTHGWHAGHLQECVGLKIFVLALLTSDRPSYTGDWGDYISLTQRLKEKADREGKDLLVVDTGDRVEGNGLYDASTPKGDYTSEIIRQQSIDIICTGNHELYKEHTADEEYLNTVPNFRESYLASNVDILVPKTGERVPLAPRFRKFTTKNQGIRVLAFGFLFDFTGNCNNTIIQPVEKTIEEQWFQDAIREPDVDVIVVAGHVPVRSREFGDIFRAVRAVRWDMPIQFLGGHTHIRDYSKYDSKAYALESGRYMETIGFASIDNLALPNNQLQTSATPTFARRYIDNNLFSFHHHTGLDESSFPTEQGQQVSNNITEARKELELDTLYGCAPQNYWLNRVRYPNKQSIFTWLEKQVIPDMVVDVDHNDTTRIVVANTGAMRFDILKGPFTRDTTYIVSPFQGGFRQIKSIPYEKARQILPLLNNDGPVSHQLPSSEMGPPRSRRMSEIVDDVPNTDEDSWSQSQQVLSPEDRQKPELTPGYTTDDDLGDDGDDTLHSSLSFYRVPNVIESRLSFPKGRDPPVVDLVFLEFMEPWIILALKFLGDDLDTREIDDYATGRSFTSMIATWVQEHWDKVC